MFDWRNMLANIDVGARVDAGAILDAGARILSRTDAGPYAGARVLSRTRLGGNPFPRSRPRVIFMCLLFMLSGLAAFPGCGVPTPTSFPHALTNEAGEPILLEEVEEIVTDSQLSDAEKRSALRELGIEDEKLIDALLMD